MNAQHDLATNVRAKGIKNVTDRFWRYVDRGGDHDCWNWSGALRPNGYGQLNVSQYPEKAHRLAFFLANGYAPVVVRHTCDNRRCVNPGHLLPGTQADNIRDAVERGRNTTPPVLRGSTNPMSKLTEDLVSQARVANASGESLHSLARRLKVDRKTITQAIKGIHWGHV